MPLTVVVVGLIGWRVQVGLMRRRASWEYVIEHEQDDDWLKLADRVKRRLHDSNHGQLRAIAAAWSGRTLSKEQVDEWTPVFQWLNRKEVVAIAIIRKHMDETLYRAWWGPDYIAEWQLADSFVTALRETGRGTPGLFSEFEALAKKWDGEAREDQT